MFNLLRYPSVIAILVNLFNGLCLSIRGEIMLLMLAILFMPLIYDVVAEKYRASNDIMNIQRIVIYIYI
jgi:hypothetical protein